jgi:polygalacturonase
LANEKGGYLKNVVVRNNTIENCNWGLTVGGWDEGYTHEMESITFMENELAEIKVTGIYLNNPDARNVSVKGNIIQGRLSYIPIKLNGGNLDETVIDGNYFDKLVEGQPVGTNYKMLE